MTEFHGMITVSEKGQISIPVDLRRDLDIKTGDRLFVIKRKDNAGIILLKTEKMNPLAEKISNDDNFFTTSNNGD